MIPADVVHDPLCCCPACLGIGPPADCDCFGCRAWRAAEEAQAAHGGPPPNDQFRLPLFPLPNVAGASAGSPVRQKEPAR